MCPPYLEIKEEGREKERNNLILNMLNEFRDVDYIHKITKYPRSDIIKVAKLASIDINI